MPLCSTLYRIQKSYEKFDVTNPQHMEAFRILCIGDTAKTGLLNIKQHPTLRFELEDNYPDIRSMMFHKVGEYHSRRVIEEDRKRKKAKKRSSRSFTR